MPKFMINGKEREVENCVPVPEGWGQLISRYYSAGEKFNIDGMYEFFRGSQAELKALAQSAYEAELKCAESIGVAYGIGPEEERVEQAKKWLANK